jgi:hypothetical protein
MPPFINPHLLPASLPSPNLQKNPAPTDHFLSYLLMTLPNIKKTMMNEEWGWRMLLCRVGFMLSEEGG